MSIENLFNDGWISPKNQKKIIQGKPTKEPISEEDSLIVWFAISGKCPVDNPTPEYLEYLKLRVHMYWSDKQEVYKKLCGNN